MSVLSKTLLSAALAGALVLGAYGLNKTSSHPLCEGVSQSTFNSELPLSHPQNLCAQEQSISWWSWLGGQSSTRQFHFLDLLELLSRFSNDPR